jgi:excisionase family DNA binding protein
MPKEEMIPEYISVGFIAKHCGVSNTTVLRWIESGRLLAFRLPGGHHRVDRKDLVKFLDEYHMPYGKKILHSAT